MFAKDQMIINGVLYQKVKLEEEETPVVEPPKGELCIIKKLVSTSYTMGGDDLAITIKSAGGRLPYTVFKPGMKIRITVVE